MIDCQNNDGGTFWSMRTPLRSTPRGLLRDILVTFGVAAFTCLTVACGSTEDARFQLEDRLRRAASASKDGIPRYARALRAKATCLSGEVTDRVGGEGVRRLIDARGDLGAASDEIGARVGELREAVHACVDVRETLIDVFESSGMTREQAVCVADQTLEDDKILTPLLVNIVFGDPGVGTAVFVAARATRGCLSADDFARLFPGR
jgi:hypothetical protein